LRGYHQIRFTREDASSCASIDKRFRGLYFRPKIVVFIPDMRGSLFAGIALPVPDEGKMRFANRGDKELYGLRRVLALPSRLLPAINREDKCKGEQAANKDLVIP
jgi:hypothetical protein